MTIGKVCQSNVVMISENTSIQDAAKQMEQHNVGSLLVVKDQSSDQTPVGIITDRDITVKLVAQKANVEQAKVSDVMSKNLLLLKSDQGIKKSLEEMCNKGVRRAPIVDENNKVCGIVAVDDLVVMMAKELNDVANLVQKQVVNG